MSAGPAIRTVSAQACRQCRKEQLQSSSRWTSRRRFSSSPVPLASTSTATRATNFINRLRFEVGQANPSLASTWRSLNAVHDEEPAKLSPDLVRQTIPILQKYRKPGRSFPKVSQGPHYRAELVEEAEALYMRYRFVASRLRETGSEPQSVAQILYWLQGLKALSYAPAAWRIWKDALEEARRNDTLVAKQISTLVLVATAKWLFVLAEHAPSPAAIAEARKEADAILAYLEANGQIDGTIASLKIRIIKHSSRYQDFAKAVKAMFGLDLDMPCAPPGLASEGTIRPLDKHSHNSILSALGKRQEFSKMVSVFESLAYPHNSAVAAYPVQRADQNSFFSFSFGWFNWRKAPAEPEVSQDAAAVEPAAQALNEETDEASVAVSDADTIVETTDPDPRPILKITALNTRTFELMIENALARSSHGVARHYMLEMLEAWEQERKRLRSAYAKLADYRVPFVTARVRSQGLLRTGRDKLSVVMRDPERPSWDEIWQPETLGPAIGPSAHSIYRIYQKLAGEWTSHLHWLKPLQALVQDVDRVLEIVRDDIRFWTNVHDKQRLLALVFRTLPSAERAAHATQPISDNETDAAGAEGDSFAGYQNMPFDPQLHLLILRKIEAELNDIYHEMYHRHTHTAAGRYIRGMLNELKGERKTSRISRLRNAIRRSERWWQVDEIADVQRAEAIMQLHTLSNSQKRSQVKNMRRIAEGRRQAVRRAILRARGTLADLERQLEPAAPPIVNAVHIRGLAAQLQDARIGGVRQDAKAIKAQTVRNAVQTEQTGYTNRSLRKPQHIRVRLGETGTNLQSSPATITSSDNTGNLPDASR